MSPSLPPSLSPSLIPQGLDQQAAVDAACARVLSLLYPSSSLAETPPSFASSPSSSSSSSAPAEEASEKKVRAEEKGEGGREEGLDTSFDYTKARKIDRLQCQDIMEGIFEVRSLLPSLPTSLPPFRHSLNCSFICTGFHGAQGRWSRGVRRLH